MDLHLDPDLDLARRYTIREAEHRIHNAFGPAKLATLGAALRLRPGDRVLDLACGSGEMLCTWAREHGVRGHGVDISQDFLRAGVARAAELGVEDLVSLEHASAVGYVAAEPVAVAACLGAAWIGDGPLGTAELLAGSVVEGGIVAVGEPFWRVDPAGLDEEQVLGCHATSRDDFHTLPGLVTAYREAGWDVVEAVLADADDWDRYAGAQWLTTRRWLDAHPDDELWEAMRADLDRAPLRHLAFTRELLGWGVLALVRR